MQAHPEKITLSYICRFWGGEDFWREILNKTEDPVNKIFSESMWDFYYCMAYILLARLTYSFSKKFARKPTVWIAALEKEMRFTSNGKRKFVKESKQDNDVTRISLYIFINFIPTAVFVAMMLVGLIAAIFGGYQYISSGVIIISYHLGYMLVPRLGLIIANGLLIQNCVLIKREWKTNPPQFIIEEQQRVEEEAQKQKLEQDTATCKTLLEECGMQFFIEYYPQIKRLPLRDVTVSDRYLSEREVRLVAAKKIVDSELSEYAFHYIIDAYSDILPSDAIERAKSLLNEIENMKGERK